MVTVVGVRFREVGKIYYFDPGELELKAGDNVIVDTIRGTEFGTVMIGNRKVEDEEIVQPLKVVRRKATEDDAERVRANREKEKNAFAVCKEKIKERGLEMKLISAEYTFDNAKILFYFTADGRVDFRELVKDLASVFRIRIELRQVGVRDETKLMGGLGGCGRPLCCASYLSDFVPVSIRMAKEQNLSLNPQKISGVCGRLMCCLKNEADTYEDLNTRLPKDGGKVITPDGREGIAETVNVLRERVRVLFTDEQGNREMEEFPASELQFTPRRKPKPCECRAAVMAEEDAYDYDASELAADAEAETDPDIKALARAEAEDALGEKTDDAADPNMVGDRKRRHRRKKNHGMAPKGETAAEGESTGSGNGAGNRKAESAAAAETGKTGAAADGTAASVKANTEDGGKDGTKGDASHRRNRRHRQRNNGGSGNSADNANGISDGNGNDGNGNEGSKNNNANNVNNSRNNAGSKNGGSGNNKAGNGNKENNAGRTSNDQTMKQNDPAGSQQYQEGEGGGTEKKHNGTYRRFRKRRPKNTAES